MKSIEVELDKFKTEKQKINILDLELNSYEVCNISISNYKSHIKFLLLKRPNDLY